MSDGELSDEALRRMKGFTGSDLPESYRLLTERFARGMRLLGPPPPTRRQRIVRRTMAILRRWE